MGMASYLKKKLRREHNSSCLPFTGRLHSRRAVTPRLRAVPPWSTRSVVWMKCRFGESAWLATHLRA
jgi:hypothetical protein